MQSCNNCKCLHFQALSCLIFQLSKTNPKEKITEDPEVAADTPSTTPEAPATPAEEPQPTPTEQPAERKISREEKNLQSDLGNYWRCTDHDPHYDGSLGRRLRARVTELNKEEEEEMMEDYWILEDERDENFVNWKELYLKTSKRV